MRIREASTQGITLHSSMPSPSSFPFSYSFISFFSAANTTSPPQHLTLEELPTLNFWTLVILPHPFLSLPPTLPFPHTFLPQPPHFTPKEVPTLKAHRTHTMKNAHGDLHKTDPACRFCSRGCQVRGQLSKVTPACRQRKVGQSVAH